ncbi:thioredoxin-dependent thiol peroxidase [Crocinitomicaceae bacterium]|nr:thioredoxin-dependent thiol peroxidase [Crocinitomicaceae bacterium]MDC1385551.1 thioredoxin-dependent thiol peroxidase [Crocinitomicaceae bacterium]
MKHLKVGDQAPDFISKDQNGNEVKLSDYKGQRFVLYFYPKDNTLGCTTQACNIRDNYGSIKKNGINIFGVSADTELKHVKFIEKFDLPFPLLADVDHELLNLYGVWGEKKFMGKTFDGIHRTTFVMDASHKIVGIIEKPKNKNHSDEILEIYKD